MDSHWISWWKMSDLSIMVNSREIQVEIIRKPIKNVYIRAQSKNSLVVSAPVKKSEADILTVINKNIHRIETMLENRKEIPVFSDREAKFMGNLYMADTIPGYIGTVTFDRDRFLFPDLSTKDKEKALYRFYSRHVKQTANDMLASLSPGFREKIGSSPVVFVSRRMKSRLGSCQPKDRIVNLNSILARYEPKYLHAILMHELVHLRVSGHQKDFYKLLLAYEPDYRFLRKQLLNLIKEDGI